MGKPTGFLEYERKLPRNRTVGERLKDWNEIQTDADISALSIQGARCMDCGVPFCHTGSALIGCPLNNLIPEWNDLVFRGKMNEAYHRLLLTNPFPEFTGRVCPAPCEGSCTAGLHGAPVTIKSIERHIADTAFAHGNIKPEIPSALTGKKVAVIGSGPAGLAAAQALCSMGHSVTVFERADRAGGLLMYGIPNMKLSKEVVQRRIELMQEEGVEFRLSTEVGKDFPAERLTADFDAVLLATGASKPRALNIDGENLKGVYFAVDYLKSATKALLDKNSAAICAKEKNVVVIGGGDTGTDCVATAIRQGAKSVVQLEIMPCLPESRAENNPWPEFPKVKKTDYGQEEAIEIFGSDPREYLTTATKIISDKNGNAKEIHTVSVEWQRDDSGRMNPIHIPNTEKTRPAELILIAAGFTGPEQELLNQLSIETEPRSNIKTSSYETNLRGVFAAGDCRRGQSLVVWAMREGIEAANVIDVYLKK